jgi:MGT family glycosyltransferase
MRGHLFPAIAILEELRRRDHVVVMRTLASEVKMLRDLGFEAHPVAAEIEMVANDDWRARTPLGAARRAADTFCARARHDAPDLAQAIDREQPDALLVDVAAWGALATAEAWGGPWAAFCPLLLPVPSRKTPPYGPGLPPAKGAAGRLRDLLGARVVEAGFDRAVRQRLNAVRAAVPVDPLEHAHELFLRPPTLLYMTAAGFDYPRSGLPRNTVMVGPCAWDPPGRLPDVLAKVEEPLVLISTSTDFQNDGNLVHTALTALAEEPCHAVATVPAASLGDLRVPANATVVPFAPHTPILAHASCAITHGGMGATQKALAHGVPVCAVPFGRDQLEVARRVEVSGAGTRLPAWRLNPDRLRRKVREAIAMRSGAERVARSFAASGGPEAAAEIIERLQKEDGPSAPGAG